MASKNNQENTVDISIEKVREILENGRTNDCYEQILLLERSGDKRALSVLMENLANRNWHVRKLAAEAIFNCGPWVVDSLRGGLASGNDDIAYWSIQILKRFKRKGHQLLLESLGQVPYNTGYEIVRALGEVKYGPSVESLVTLMSDPSWELCKEASDSLVRIGKKGLPALKNSVLAAGAGEFKFDSAYWSVKTIVRIIGSAAYGYIKKFINLDDPRMRMTSLVALGDEPIDGARVSISDFLKDSDPTVRAVATYLCDSSGLINEEQRDAVLAESIAKPGDGRFPLDTEPVNAFQALDRIVWAYYARLEGVRVDAPRIFATSLTVGEWIVKTVSACALQRMGSDGLKYLEYILERGDSEERYWAIRVLVDMGEHDSMRSMLEVLDKGETKWKYIILDAFDRSRDVNMIEPLSKLLGDGNWTIRKKAAAILSSFYAETIEDIIKVNARRREGIDDIVYWTAKVVHDYGKRGERELIRVMNSGDPDIRTLAVSVMCAIFTQPLQEAIIEFMAVGDDDAVAIVASAVIMNGDSTVVSELLAKLGSSSELRRIRNNFLSAIRGEHGVADSIVNMGTAKLLVDNYYNSGSNQYFEKLVEFFLLVDDHKALDEILRYLKADVNRFVGFIISVISEARTSARCRYFLTKIVGIDNEFFKILKNIIDDMVAAHDFERLNQLLAWDDHATAVLTRVLSDNHRPEVTPFLAEILRRERSEWISRELFGALCRKFSRADRSVRSIVRAMLHGREEEYLKVIVRAISQDSAKETVDMAADFLRELGFKSLPEGFASAFGTSGFPGAADMVESLGKRLSEYSQ